jgi:peptide/nickel transport system substrate-binding protein
MHPSAPARRACRVPTTRRAPNRGAIGLLVLVVALGACGSEGPQHAAPPTTEEGLDTDASTVEPQPGGVLRYGLTGETDGWDPARNRWAGPGQLVANAIYDRLAAYDAESEPQPFLAHSWSSNEDFTVWTIRLREGVTFHNGEALDADALKLNIDNHLSSALSGPSLSRIDEVVVTAPLEVEVRMRAPWSTFPHILTTQVGAIAAPGMLADEMEGRLSPIGTGPFVFETWTPDEELRVTANPDYWLDGYPLLDAIEFVPVPDELARQDMFLSGEIDIMQADSPHLAMTGDEWAEAETAQSLHAEGLEAGEQMIMINMLDPVMQDERLRLAIAHAVEREAIVGELFDDYYRTTDSPFVEDGPWYVDVDAPGYDPARASELVAEYEAENGPVTISFKSDPALKSLEEAQVLAEQIEAVGIDVVTSTHEQQDAILAALTGDYQIMMWRQFDALHPDGDYIWWHSENAADVDLLALNMARNRDPELDAALDAARATDDVDAQRAAYATFQERLAADVPYVFLYHGDDTIIASPSVMDIEAPLLPTGSPQLGLYALRHEMRQLWLAPDPTD